MRWCPNRLTKHEPFLAEDIVITVLKNQTVRLKDELVALSDLDQRLLGLFRNAANRVIFVRGEKDLDFG